MPLAIYQLNVMVPVSMATDAQMQPHDEFRHEICRATRADSHTSDSKTSDIF